jgi:membrane protein DedA with SNARE-associated domain
VGGLVAWLTGLPIGALYFAIAVIAAIENFFPPVPADTIVALGAFLAARGHGTALGSFLATWLGNVGGAMVMYAVGRRFGADRLERRFLGERGPAAESRIATLYGRYGIFALFLSRFLPGVRAVVPPVAGALRIPPIRATAAIGLASAIWYGLITYAGFYLGSEWESVLATMREYGKIAGIGAAVVLAVGLLAWWIRSKRTRV